MTEQDKQDESLAEYLAGSSALSKLYQGLTTDEPPEKLERAIIEAARSVQTDASRTVSVTVYRWALPAALAAILILSLASVLLLREPARLSDLAGKQADEKERVSSAPGRDYPLTETDQTDAEDASANAPEAWLEKILLLEQAGNTAEAQREFNEFRHRYPDFELTDTRFDELKKYQGPE